MIKVAWFRRDAARDAVRTQAPGRVSLAGFALLTAVLGLLAVLVALPMRRERERRMVDAARAELASVFAAAAEFRAQHYRLPGSLDELRSAGWSRAPAVAICSFRHHADERRFDDHLEIVVHHRASRHALIARYPAAGASPVEVDAGEACKPNAATAAATRGYP